MSQNFDLPIYHPPLLIALTSQSLILWQIRPLAKPCPRLVLGISMANCSKDLIALFSVLSPLLISSRTTWSLLCVSWCWSWRNLHQSCLQKFSSLSCTLNHLITCLVTSLTLHRISRPRQRPVPRLEANWHIVSGYDFNQSFEFCLLGL